MYGFNRTLNIVSILYISYFMDRTKYQIKGYLSFYYHTRDFHLRLITDI